MMMDFIWNNKAWIFDGIGVSVLAGIAALLWRRRNRLRTQRQTGGHGSTNIQAGRDVKL
jgi:hypothetical protein